jgi:hypothetical protein
VTSTTTTASDDLGADRAAATPRLRWWREAAYVLAFYMIYSWVRNQFGSAGTFSANASSALDNAEFVIDIERAIGLFIEESIQQAFLGADWFIRFWNIFYGSLHFIVTGSVMVFLYRKFPARYQRYRSVLACTTGLALIGFAFFPLMPPRLLTAGGEWGANLQGVEFVDTLASVGGTWSFDSGAMNRLSNQWAAMPSLHIGWATWCTMALFPLLRSRWGRALAVIYPFLTLFAVVVTANHYWIDAVGGLIVLGAGFTLGGLLTDMLNERSFRSPLQRSWASLRGSGR